MKQERRARIAQIDRYIGALDVRLNEVDKDRIRDEVAQGRAAARAAFERGAVTGRATQGALFLAGAGAVEPAPPAEPSADADEDWVIVEPTAAAEAAAAVAAALAAHVDTAEAEAPPTPPADAAGQRFKPDSAEKVKNLAMFSAPAYPPASLPADAAGRAPAAARRAEIAALDGRIAAADAALAPASQPAPRPASPASPVRYSPLGRAFKIEVAPESPSRASGARTLSPLGRAWIPDVPDTENPGGAS